MDFPFLHTTKGLTNTATAVSRQVSQQRAKEDGNLALFLPTPTAAGGLSRSASINMYRYILGWSIPCESPASSSRNERKWSLAAKGD